MEKEIIWSKTALEQLENIYFYLIKTTKSKTTSNKVVDTIYESVTILKSNWEIYELDEMKKSNSGNFRAYEIYNYRILYKVTPNEIYIIRIRDTKRNPKKI